MIRKTLWALLILIILLFSLAFLVLGAVFVRPQLVIDQSNFEKILQKYAPLNYQLTSFEFQHSYHSLWEREINLGLKGFTFEQLTDDPKSLKVAGELKELQINFKIFYQNGFKVESNNLNQIHFESLSIKLAQSDGTSAQVKQEAINIKEIYQKLWMDILPELHLKIDQVQLIQENKTFALPLEVIKKKKSLSLNIFEFDFKANPQRARLFLSKPEQLWDVLAAQPLPKELEELELEVNFHLNDQHHYLESSAELLAGTIDLKAVIPNQLDPNKGQESLKQILQKLQLQIEYPNLISSLDSFLPIKTHQQMQKNQIHAALSSRLQISQGQQEDLKIEIHSLIDFEVKSTKLELVHQTAFEIETAQLLGAPEVLLTQSALGTKAEVKIDQVTSKWKNFHENLFALPAPLNSMEGDLLFALSFSRLNQESLQAHFNFTIDLEGHQQNLKISSLSTLAFGPKLLIAHKDDRSSHSFGSLQTQINIDRVNLRLPHWQAQATTPQFVADARIVKDKKTLNKPKSQGPAVIDLDIELKTPKDHPLKVATNLLNSPIQMALDLQIKGEKKSGTIKILPLNLEIFKRKISLQELTITLADPALPQIKGLVQFHLPQYLISLQLEGTSEQMRHHFTSTPPLPQSDIYAVLLFGRPMTELSGDDRAAANQTQQILSDGLLSLSVLYFLSGGPIQSIGFNPDAQSVSAQIGLSKNSSLNVSTSASGQNRASVRRSLGSGWYIDTSVQNSTNPSINKQNDYGVLLEKIMAY